VGGLEAGEPFHTLMKVIYDGLPFFFQGSFTAKRPKIKDITTSHTVIRLELLDEFEENCIRLRALLVTMNIEPDNEFLECHSLVLDIKDLGEIVKYFRQHVAQHHA
jgi:hypothetical protein